MCAVGSILYVYLVQLTYTIPILTFMGTGEQTTLQHGWWSADGWQMFSDAMRMFRGAGDSWV